MSKPTQSQINSENELYMKIWENDLSFQRLRWTLVTFFIGISFGVLGLSFQTKLDFLALLAMRITGVFIYWFGWAMHMHHRRFNNALRAILLDMEVSGQVSINLQIQIKKHLNSLFRKRISVTALITIFGCIYTAEVLALTILRL
jgi:hypothetical protein